MKRTSGKLLIIGALTFLINTLLVGVGLSQLSGDRKAYEAAYLYITDSRGRDYPHNGTPSWGDNGDLTNGIAHDDANWYISALGNDGFGFPDNTWVIWRIPVSEALDQNFSENPAVSVVHLKDVPALNDNRYGHAGDLDTYRYEGMDYLLVPLTGYPLFDQYRRPIPGTTPPPAIAVFRADALSFIGYAPLGAQQGAGWCAVAANGDLITSDNHTDVLLRYAIPWSLIASSGYLGQFSVTHKDTHPLRDEFGNSLLLNHMQGGEFTPSGELLYVNCGIFKDRFPTDGIHVFDTASWKRVQRSFNSGFRYSCCPPYFIYRFDNTFEGGEEPEGLTIWDLDDGRAPNVRGQLHVLLYNHNYTSTNRVYLKHYTRKIYVYASAPPPPPKSEYDPPPLQGTPEQPFDTVGNAFNWYPAWDGAEIVIKTGSYPETGTFSKRVRLTSQGGAAILGQ